MALKALITQEESNILKILLQEGQAFQQTISTSNQTFGAALTKNLPGGFTVYPGWEFIPLEGHLSCYPSNRDIFLYANIGAGSPTNYLPFQTSGINRVDFNFTLPFALTEGSSFNTIAERISTSDGDTPFSVRGGVNGILIYKGWDKISDYKILLEGDSITQNSAFLSGNDSLLWQGKIRSYYDSLDGIDAASIINRAKGGSNSTNWVNLQIEGALDIDKEVNLRMAMLGTNDVIQAYQANGSTLPSGVITTLINTYISNLTKRLTYHTSRYGNSIPFIVLGATPLENTVEEAAMVQLRNAARNYVLSIGGGIWYGGSSPIAVPTNNIWFTSFGQTDSNAGLWTANVNSNYIETTTGTGVHPNAASNALMGNYIINMLTVNNIR